MDVEEIKKYSKNKIEADNLIQQVRQQIKETTWEKQNLREGFTETFKPLISQFEDPGKDSKKQNIFTQNKEMLQNQLALTQGIKGNQLALKDIKDKQDIFNRGFEQYERLADLGELPKLGAIEDGEDDKDDQARAPTPQSPTPTPPKSPTPTPTTAPQAAKDPIANFNIEDFNRNLNNKEFQDILSDNDYRYLPSYYFDKDIELLNDLISNVKLDLEDAGKNITNTAIIKNDGFYNLAFPKSQNPRTQTLENIKIYNAFSVYLTNLNFLYMFKNKSGSGLFGNPKELLHRFELLNGSLAAGNNGVLPEYIQIAHRLRDLGILSNNQLNTLLRKVI